jgi:hypothetical protein
MSGKLLLKLEAVHFMLANHTSNYYSFLEQPVNSRNRCAALRAHPQRARSVVVARRGVPWRSRLPLACSTPHRRTRHTRCRHTQTHTRTPRTRGARRGGRTAYYHTLARLLFMEDAPSRFKTFMQPLQNVRAPRAWCAGRPRVLLWRGGAAAARACSARGQRGRARGAPRHAATPLTTPRAHCPTHAPLPCAHTHAHQAFAEISARSSSCTNPSQLRQLTPQAAVVGLFRDLRGIATATNTRRTYSLLFDWLVRRQGFGPQSLTISPDCRASAPPLARGSCFRHMHHHHHPITTATAATAAAANPPAVPRAHARGAVLP